MRIRDIKREEIKEIRELDRSEIIEQIYYYRNGRLVLEDEYIVVENWILEELEQHIRDLYDFYMGLGCKIASEINPELFKLEPEDIHLELLI